MSQMCKKCLLMIYFYSPQNTMKKPKYYSKTLKGAFNQNAEQKCNRATRQIGLVDCSMLQFLQYLSFNFNAETRAAPGTDSHPLAETKERKRNSQKCSHNYKYLPINKSYAKTWPIQINVSVWLKIKCLTISIIF